MVVAVFMSAQRPSLTAVVGGQGHFDAVVVLAQAFVEIGGGGHGGGVRVVAGAEAGAVRPQAEALAGGVHELHRPGGACEWVAWATIRASGLSPRLAASSADISTVAAAPSEIDDEDAAVSTPSLPNDGRRVGIFAVSIRPGCSSVSTTTSPLRVLTVTGTISSLRSEEHTSELQSLMRISYAVFCLKKKNNKVTNSK